MSKAAFKDVRIEIRPSSISGVGVFAVHEINAGDFVAEGIHQEDYHDLVPWKIFDSFPRLLQKKIRDFCIGTPDGFIPPEDFDFNKMTVEWYMNHSCDGNVGFDKKGDFIAIRRIAADEEITYDYGLAESNPEFELKPCKCGNRDCRHVMTGNDWKDPEFREKHLNHMLPKLREEP